MHIDILIGCDQYRELITGEVRRGKTGPVAVSTKLGWVLSGPVTLPEQHQSSASLLTHTLRVDTLCLGDSQSLDDQLKSFWNLESFGAEAATDHVLDDFQTKIRFTDGRYQVSQPWKDFPQSLSDNYQLCQIRL